MARPAPGVLAADKAPQSVVFSRPERGNIEVMIEFFVLLIVLMVLAVALGSWMRPGRQVILDRQPVVRRRRLVRERHYY